MSNQQDSKDPKRNEPKSPDTPGAQEGVKQMPDSPPTQVERTTVGADGKAIDPHRPAVQEGGASIDDQRLKEQQKRETEKGPDPVRR